MLELRKKKATHTEIELKGTYIGNNSSDRNRIDRNNYLNKSGISNIIRVPLHSICEQTSVSLWSVLERHPAKGMGSEHVSHFARLVSQ